MPGRTSLESDVPLELEIFFDLTCPFFFMGKVMLDRVLLETGIEADITWSPYILYPWLPAGGLDFQAAHAEKYGARSRPMQLEVERQVRDLGLPFDHSRVVKVPNTIDAHRAVRFADRARRAAQMIEAILRAYFLDGRDIGDRRVLGDLVGEVGLDGAAFCARMAADDLRAEVLAAHEKSKARGTRSVPAYRLEGVHFEKTADLVAELRWLAHAFPVVASRKSVNLAS